MIALVDAGNTRVKWAYWAAGQWLRQGAVEIAASGSMEEVFRGQPVAWAGIACVAGAAVRERLQRALADVPAFWLESQARAHGIVNRYADPGALGVDRFAALIACRRLGYAPCVVVNAGTAVTVDALAGSGDFLGGMILPGAGLMRKCLATGTAGVGVVHGHCRDFPQTTGDAVETGIWSGLAGAVERLRARLAESEKRTVAVVVGGGDAAALLAQLSPPARQVDNLVMEGLLWVARDLNAPGV